MHIHKPPMHKKNVEAIRRITLRRLGGWGGQGLLNEQGGIGRTKEEMEIEGQQSGHSPVPEVLYRNSP